MYFDDDDVSAALEILSGEVYLYGQSIRGRPKSEVIKFLGSSGKHVILDDDIIEIPEENIKLYCMRKDGKIKFVSLLLYSDNYLNNYTLNLE